MLDAEIIKKTLLSFDKVINSLSLEDQKDLFQLLIREITVWSFDPQKEKAPQERGAFITKIRTKWYKIKLDLYQFPEIETYYQSLSREKASSDFQNNWLPTTDSEHYKRHLSKCKEIHILVKMYRHRGRGTSISLYDPLPVLPQPPQPVYKNIVLMAVKVEEYLNENPQRTQTAAGNHFGITRARVSQLMTIVENLPDDFISSMKTTEDQSLIKRFSGKTLLRIIALSTPEQRQSYIETIQNRISK